MRRLVPTGASLAAAALVLGGTAAAARQPTQQIVLPGPVPYPTVSPPVTGNVALPRSYLLRLGIASAQRVLVGVDGTGRAVALHVQQRLVVSGKGDYQFAIGGPVVDVRAAPGSESEPGLRTDQVLWAGFSPGRKVLAADITLRAAPVARYLPVRLHIGRDGDRVTLTVVNATRAPGVAYTGFARTADLATLLDSTRRASLSGSRLQAAFATFSGTVHARKTAAEAPLRVVGELSLPGGRPVRFARTLGDGAPLSLTVRAHGTGEPKVLLRVSPAPVVRLLRPPGAATWTAAVLKHSLPPAFLLRRLFESRLRLVRADQYQSFLADPDADGVSRSVYVYATVKAAPAPVAEADTSTGGGNDILVIVLVAAVSLVAAAGGIVVWAHS
ncbi:MAG TPA: hypothetical protein VLU96_04860 [Gaiellaceae bacterium]|nr:hypothetical protein [Gaiellaceae bacterium]